MARNCISSTFLAVGLCALSVPVGAQAPFVVPEFYNTIRPDFGTSLPLCILPESATAHQDRAMAEALAEVMLLTPRIVEMTIDMDALDEHGIWPVIYEELSGSCIGVMGVHIIRGQATPDWLTISRPYLDAPYVLIARQDGISSLRDLEAGSTLGVPLYTPIDNEVMREITYGSNLEGIRRLPYDRPELMKSLMETGDFDAAIVWEPHLDAPGLQPLDFFESLGSVEPLRESTREIGVLLRSQDELVRTMIDQAIEIIESENLLAR